MERLFVYGTLQDSAVQQKVFGRTAKSTPAQLNGYKKGQVEIHGTIYPIAIADSSASITGQVLEVSEEELILMDEYETEAYQRITATLASGDRVWVYCQPLSTRPTEKVI